MSPRRIILPFLVLLSPTAVDASGQEPVAPYDASGRYRTAALEVQVTGAFNGGRDALLSWGALRVGGTRGEWMQRTDLAVGLRVGETLVDRLMVGPRLSAGVAFPGAFFELDHGTRAEPYLLMGGGAYGVADVEEEARVGISPSAFAGIGVRVFDDEWDVALTQLEIVVQQRFGFDAQRPQIYIRLGRAVPPGRRGPPRPPIPLPGGPTSLLPPRGLSSPSPIQTLGAARILPALGSVPRARDGRAEPDHGGTDGGHRHRAQEAEPVAVDRGAADPGASGVPADAEPSR